jgi:hypothetical protein
MAGTDNVRGIAYQQAQALLAALDVLDDPDLTAVRVEGMDDVVDLELLNRDNAVVCAKQVKTRAAPYSWSRSEIVAVLRRWAELPAAADATFEFVTDGHLGPSGEALHDALSDASRGDVKRLAELLEQDPSSQIVHSLARARIRTDPGGLGALVSRAERQIVAMLPQVRTPEDAVEQARRVAQKLFLLLFEAAGDSDAIARVLTREQIAAALGVASDQPASKRWPGMLRKQYLEAVISSPVDHVVQSPSEAFPTTTRPTLRPWGSADSGDPLDVLVLLESAPALLAGRTGTGKTTAALTVCQEAARAGRVVLVAHAESYIPGRLEALAADAIADRIGVDLPFATGRQVLADRDITLLIDGASEVPSSAREALGADLLASVSAQRGARVVVLGRDVAALRGIFPTSITPLAFVMSSLDSNQQLDIASRSLLGVAGAELEGSSKSGDVRARVMQVQHVLGDGASNPLLFTMALALIEDGIPFTNRASLYAAFVQRLAERSGATGIITATAVVGVAFARLLDQGRRYADPIEWPNLLSEGVRMLGQAGSDVDAKEVDRTARRCGLITPMGYTQTVVPIHDSFADYLAGVAHARGLEPLPTRLQHGDEQRMLFTAEIGGVEGSLAARVVHDLPYLVVRLAHLDARPLVDGSPAEAEQLLSQLAPAGMAGPVAMWRMADGRVLTMRHSAGSDSGWIDEPRARAMLKLGRGAVVAAGGPLKAAVRLWRQELGRCLDIPRQLAPRIPATAEQVAATLAEHARECAASTAALVSTLAAPGRSTELLAAVGPLGLTAEIQNETNGAAGFRWPISYFRSHEVTVVVAGTTNVLREIPVWSQGSGSVEAFLGHSPTEEASSRVRDAINSLTAVRWL